MEIITLYPCACCETATTGQIFDICHGCGWERDPWNEENPNSNALGPNGYSLNEYRVKWVEAGKPRFTDVFRFSSWPPW